MKFLTVVNRTSGPLKGIWDGRHYEIPPGKSSYPEIQARKFKDQNVKMGTENPYNLHCEYLIGIEEDRDDCSPTEQSDELERWRTKEQRSESPDKMYKTAKGGLYAEERQSSLPLDSTFAKP